MRKPTLLASLLVVSLLLAPLSGAALLPTLGPEEPATPAVPRAEPPRLAALSSPDARAGPSFGPVEKASLTAIPDPSQASAPTGTAVTLVAPDDCGTHQDAGDWHDPMPLSEPGTCDGMVGGSDWQDVYSLHVEGPAVLGANLVSGGSDGMLLCIYHDLATDYGATARCDDAVPDRPGHTATYVKEPGTWQVLVDANGAEAPYQLTIDVHGWATPGDCGETDAPDTSEGVTPVGFPSDCEASLDPEEDQTDWYALHLDAGQAATVTVAPDVDLDADLCVFEQADPTRALECSILPVGYTDRVLLSPAAGGDYLVRVVWWDGAGPYALRVSAATPQDDCGSGQDMGSRRWAAQVTVPLACTGMLDAGAGDLWDAYAFTVEERGLHVDLAAAGDDAMACLYAAGFSWPVRCTDASDNDTAFHYQARSAGMGWVVGVLIRDGATPYTLGITAFTPSAQDDCASGQDADEHPRGGVPIESGEACQGTLLVSEGDIEDAYLLANLSASHIDATVRTADGSAFVACLYTTRGSNGYDGSCHSSESGEVSLERMLSSPGDVMLTVEAARHADTDLAYDLTVTVSPRFSDCDTGGDAPGWPDDTTPPMLTPPVSRCLGKLFGVSGDHEDRYLVHAGAGQAILMAVEIEEGSLWYACIEDATGGGFCTGVGTWVLGTPGTAVYPVTETGDYAVSLWTLDSTVTTTYRLSVAVQ